MGALRLEEHGRVFDRIALVEFVPGGGHDQGPAALGKANGAGLERRGIEATEAEVDDLRPVLDRVDDPGSLVDVADRTVPVRDLNAEQARISAEAGNAFAVRDRTCCERGHERPVTVEIADVLPVLVDDAVDLGRLCREVGLPYVAAGVD